MKTIVVTGATGDLGHSVMRRLSQDYRCIALYRSEKSWNELRSAIAGNIEGVSSAEEVSGSIFSAVLLAGGFKQGSSPADFEAMLEANLLSAVRAVEPLRDKIEDGGRIVAISSAASLTHPAGLGAYVASKSALNAYIDVLSKELLPRRILVNALLPDALDTPAMRKTMSRDLLVPLERVGETIAFLLSEGAGSITGQLIGLTR